mmetsp:Transcript_25552/g.79689  ORF Transcript_25552/g.79689 Transcript_25552/m.79689 type:complete len:164 (+) Transcript_25552:478-969(+)
MRTTQGSMAPSTSTSTWSSVPTWRNHETNTSLPWVWRRVLLDGERRGGQRAPMVLYGHWLRSPKPLAELKQHCEAAGVVMSPFEDAGADAGECSASAPQLDVVQAATAEPTATPHEGDGSDSDSDWFGQIFDSSGFHEEPIFFVYRVELCGGNLRGHPPGDGA